MLSNIFKINKFYDENEKSRTFNLKTKTSVFFFFGILNYLIFKNYIELQLIHIRTE